MRKVLATLTPREEHILRMRFGIGLKTDCTLEEVGQLFAVTRETNPYTVKLQSHATSTAESTTSRKLKT